MTRSALAAIAVLASPAVTLAQTAAWSNYAGDAQHTALSPSGSQSLTGITWQTPVDLNPQYSGNDLLIHYGSPVITANNTVIVPVKTGATDGFRVEAHSGTTGALLWTQSTDYSLPPHPPPGWTPSYSPTIAPNNTLYYAGAGGTVYERNNLDAAGAVTPTQLSFLGAHGDATDLSNYTASKSAYDANVRISTPITSDAQGNIYFGYQVQNPAAVGGLTSGLARIDSTGHATIAPIASLAGGDTTIQTISTNSAPAVTADGSKVYVAISTNNVQSTGQFGNGYLVELNASNLSVAGRANLFDPHSGQRAILSNDGTASPMIGPNGDVYMGVLESPFSSSKGWMLHFDSALTQTKTPGAFGWDSTASVVPKSMVPSYTGSSPYLIMTKYNDYAGLGGSGINKLAILDPNATQTDPRTGATVMKEVLTIAGVTPDPEYASTHPGAVREWCINSAAIDPKTFSVLANSEDGKLYRWDLRTNTFTQSATLTAGVGEAYTPTVIGPDGTVYAINNGILFAIAPEPVSVLGIAGGVLILGVAARRRTRTSRA